MVPALGDLLIPGDTGTFPVWPLKVPHSRKPSVPGKPGPRFTLLLTGSGLARMQERPPSLRFMAVFANSGVSTGMEFLRPAPWQPWCCWDRWGLHPWGPPASRWQSEGCLQHLAFGQRGKASGALGPGEPARLTQTLAPRAHF